MRNSQPPKSRSQREAELLAMRPEVVLRIYKDACGIREGTTVSDPDLPAGMLVSEMIELILNAEFPDSHSSGAS